MTVGADLCRHGPRRARNHAIRRQYPPSSPMAQTLLGRTTNDKTVSIVIDIFDLHPLSLTPAIDS